MSISDFLDQYLGADWIVTVIQTVVGIITLVVTNTVAKVNKRTKEITADVGGVSSIVSTTITKVTGIVENMVGDVTDIKSQIQSTNEALVLLANIISTGFVDTKGVSKPAKEAILKTIQELAILGEMSKEKYKEIMGRVNDTVLDEMDEALKEVAEVTEKTEQEATETDNKAMELYNTINNE